MSKRTILLVHVAVWALLFLLPLTFLSRFGSFNLLQYLMASMSPFLMMVVFYTNYLWLTPRYFVTDKHRYYWLFNIVMVIALGVFLHYWVGFTRSMFGDHRPGTHRAPIV